MNETARPTIHAETIYAGVRIADFATEIVKLGGALKALGSRQILPSRYELDELRNAYNRCDDVINSYHALLQEWEFGPPASIEAEAREATVEIVTPPADEHQAEIAAGAVDFQAYRDAKAVL